VTLAFTPGQVVLPVAANGVGATQGAGFGLAALAERVAALGGDTSAGNARDGGFELRTAVPA
ncbi:MAG: sensor histidine kinase, partial [Nonomuraea sp.]|nr:sensor histidine kinase [Nonomuraea sp.]